MILTKKLLQERLDKWIAQRKQCLAQVNACEGSMMAIRELLSNLDCEEPKKKRNGSKKARSSKGK